MDKCPCGEDVKKQIETSNCTCTGIENNPTCEKCKVKEDEYAFKRGMQ